MGSPVTLSGFNNIDFNLILQSIMTQERAPLGVLEDNRSSLQSQDSEYTILATHLADVELAAEALATTDAFSARAVTNTDATALAVSATTAATIGTYDIVVNELARSQVIGTNSTHTDKDTTTVATGGTITIDGVAVTVSSAVTLEGLSDAINATNNITVTATVVANSSSTYQLVLTGNSTGVANAFTLTNALTAARA